MKYIIVSLVAYLIGSYCSSIPISKKYFGDDIRNKGSGNAGATNMARCYGIKAGLIVLGCDMLKTVVAMLIGKYLAGDSGEALAGAFCIVGHCFPIFFGFRGGKGVSVGAALGLMQGIGVFAIIMAVFFLVAILGKKVSLASMTAAASLPFAALILSAPEPLLIMSVFSGVLVIIMHHENIKRLISGTESDFKFKKM